MDVYFTKKFSCNRKAWVCFPASNEVLMISPLLSDTLKLFRGNKVVRTPSISHPLGLYLAGLKANSKHSWWPWRQPLWRKQEETSAGTAPPSRGSCFYAEPPILDPRLSCAAAVPQCWQCLAMTPAELDPNVTHPWPSWFLQPQHMTRTFGWMF